MPNQPSLDRVFHALSDNTRLAVLENLRQGRQSVSELARPFKMAMPSFMQHLSVLENSGLVWSEKAGRQRTYGLVPGGLSPASDWLAQQRVLWEARLDRFDTFLLSEKKENEN